MGISGFCSEGSLIPLGYMRRDREGRNGIFIFDDLCRKCPVYWISVLEEIIGEVHDTVREV